MDNANIAVSSAIGAVVAVGATYVLKHVLDATTKYDRKIEEDKAFNAGRRVGYTEGQESVAAQFAQTITSPQDFTTNR